jgi:hypothetical protein
MRRLLCLGFSLFAACSGSPSPGDSAVESGVDAADIVAQDSTDANPGETAPGVFPCGSMTCGDQQVCVIATACTNASDGGCPPGSHFVPQHACFSDTNTYRCADLLSGCTGNACTCASVFGGSEDDRCTLADGGAPGQAPGCY